MTTLALNKKGACVTCGAAQYQLTKHRTESCTEHFQCTPVALASEYEGNRLRTNVRCVRFRLTDHLI
jgi:hypothetical protein